MSAALSSKKELFYSNVESGLVVSTRNSDIAYATLKKEYAIPVDDLKRLAKDPILALIQQQVSDEEDNNKSNRLFCQQGSTSLLCIINEKNMAKLSE